MFCRLITVVMISSSVIVLVNSMQCSRANSRVVRNILTKSIYRVYNDLQSSPPTSCPLHSNNDRYRGDEEHKHAGGHNRWECGYCGKAFIAEFHLDNHFDARHARAVKKETGSSCLADYCDLFRCDVITRRGSPDYWLMALCIEDDMRELVTACMDLLRLCLDKTLHRNASLRVTKAFNDSVCSLLTCNRYWETPQKDNDELPQMLHIIWTVFVLFAIIIYYFITCSHFLMDDSLWPQSKPDGITPHRDYRRVARSPRGQQALHQRRAT